MTRNLLKCCTLAVYQVMIIFRFDDSYGRHGPDGPEDLQHLRPGGLLLAESPVFFLSFGPVLRRLQGLTAGDHGTLPLASCLLGKAMSAEDARQPLPWSLGGVISN